MPSLNTPTHSLLMSKIGLSMRTWPMPLFKDDVLRRAMQRFPLRDMALQGAHLDRLIAPRMTLAQQRKQGGPLQGRVSFQLRHDPRPVFFKWVRARSPRMGTSHLA